VSITDKSELGFITEMHELGNSTRNIEFIRSKLFINIKIFAYK